MTIVRCNCRNLLNSLAMHRAGFHWIRKGNLITKKQGALLFCSGCLFHTALLLKQRLEVLRHLRLVLCDIPHTLLENLRFEMFFKFFKFVELSDSSAAQLLVFTYCDKPAMYHPSPLLLCANANATFPRFKRNPSNASIPIWLRTRTYYHLASARIERCNFGEWFQILRRKKTISFGYYLLDIPWTFYSLIFLMK